MKTPITALSRRGPSATWRGGLMLLAAILAAAAAAHAAIPDVSGTWAERQILSEFAVLPLVGGVPRTSTTILRVTVEQSASALVLRATYCASSIDNGSPLAATTIPDAFLVSLGEIVIAASIDESGQFVQPWATEVRGARLAAPETDPLPTRADDPRVIDQDGDGKPGLTVHVSALGFISGDVYVVQRIRTRCIGVLVALGRIQGTFECTSEQVVLSATSSIFESELPSRPNPEMDKSTFVLVRIDPSWSCAKVLAERANLFGR